MVGCISLYGEKPPNPVLDTLYFLVFGFNILFVLLAYTSLARVSSHWPRQIFGGRALIGLLPVVHSHCRCMVCVWCVVLCYVGPVCGTQ